MPAAAHGPDPERVAELYGEALELPRDERPAFLAQVCGEDGELVAELDSLLAAHDLSGPFLARPPTELLNEVAGNLPAATGTRVGPYRLLAELGRGGMGVVYLAERADGAFEQQVALKLISRAFVSPALLERFLRERQILARLTHPHIAQLLDGGVTEDGSPYFAMELVRGLPLLAYCEQHQLPIDGRLELFDQACRAVSHAHAQLVVHRDLKPSNMLVGEDGNLKLLDFGIARLLAGEDQTASQLTRLGLQPLTPEYAAPEQREGRPATTTTDVYSLGVVLTELLTGERPEPTFTTPGAPPPRGFNGRRLDSDLVAILEQALAPDPAARTSSVEAFAEDVQRYRGGLPVKARPATLSYRAKKLFRRHRLAFAASGAAALALTVGLVASLWQARIAARERDVAERALSRAERVQRFLSDVFEGAGPASTKGEDLTARELLNRGAARIDTELAGQPEAQIDLLHTLARVNIKLGRYDEARRLAQRGLEVALGLHGPRHLEVARAQNLLGNLEVEQGHYEAAEPRYREALALRRELLGTRSHGVAATLNDLAIVLQVRSQMAEAEAMYRESLTIHQEVGTEDTEVATTWSNLGGLLYLRRELPGAEEAMRQALRLWQQHLDADHPLIAAGLGDLALVRSAQGDLGETEALNRQALGIERRVLGPEHPTVAIRLNNLGRTVLFQGDPAGAETLLREALGIYHKAYGEEHPNIAISLDNLAVAIARQGRLDQALPFFRQALAMHQKLRGGDHPTVALSLGKQAEALAAAGRAGEALPLAEEAVAILEAQPGEPHPELAKLRSQRDALLTSLAAGPPLKP